MSREIKFRAWDGVGNMEHFSLTSDWLNKAYVASHEPVMQYTGLKDKNGVEIYEGDILEYISPEPQPDDIADRYVVEWKGYGFVASWHHPHRPTATSDGHLSLQGADTDMKVIGNIHEHPHLLTNQENQ